MNPLNNGGHSSLTATLSIWISGSQHPPDSEQESIGGVWAGASFVQDGYLAGEELGVKAL